MQNVRDALVDERGNLFKVTRNVNRYDAQLLWFARSDGRRCTFRVRLVSYTASNISTNRTVP
eukprot:1616114-Pyramimonas_sp.AAC.1